MNRLTRRDLLRLLGVGAGAAVLSPLTSGISRADGEGACRFVFVVEGNGFYPATVLSDMAREALDAASGDTLGGAPWWRGYAGDSVASVDDDFSGAPALTPILTAPEVLAQTNVVHGLSSKIVGGGHSAMHGVLASARTISGVPGGETIDAYLSRLPQVRAATPYAAVRLAKGPDNTPVSFGLCAYGARKPAPTILSPELAYLTLFGSVGSDEARAWFQRQVGLLEFARGDVSAEIAAFEAGPREKAKLEQYLSSVEELQRRRSRLIELGPMLEEHTTVAPADNPLIGTNDPLDTFRAHLQLTTAALKAQLTNVAVVGCGTGGSFGMTYTLSNVGRHDLHHGIGSSAEFKNIIYEVTRLQVEAVVGMAAELAATPEPGGEGSMLDHTVIVYIGDNGEQHHSQALQFPAVVIGGRSLGLVGCKSLIYPGLGKDNHRQVSNLWNTLGYLTGDMLDAFGKEGPSRVAEGPLSELLA